MAGTYSYNVVVGVSIDASESFKESDFTRTEERIKRRMERVGRTIEKTLSNSFQRSIDSFSSNTSNRLTGAISNGIARGIITGRNSLDSFAAYIQIHVYNAFHSSIIDGVSVGLRQSLASVQEFAKEVTRYLSQAITQGLSQSIRGYQSTLVNRNPSVQAYGNTSSGSIQLPPLTGGGYTTNRIPTLPSAPITTPIPGGTPSNLPAGLTRDQYNQLVRQIRLDKEQIKLLAEKAKLNNVITDGLNRQAIAAAKVAEAQNKIGTRNARLQLDQQREITRQQEKAANLQINAANRAAKQQEQLRREARQDAIRTAREQATNQRRQQAAQDRDARRQQREEERRLRERERAHKQFYDRITKGSVDALRQVGYGLIALGVSLSASVTAPLVALGKYVVQAALDIDRVRSLLSALEGSFDAANRRIDTLRELVRQSVGVTDDLATRIYTQLKGIGGVAVDTIERQIKAVGKLSIITDLIDVDAFNRNLIQLFTQGFERADIKEVLGRVPFFNQILESAFGTSDPAKLRELFTKSKKTLNQFLAELSAAILNDPRLIKLTDNLSIRLEKAVSRIKFALEPIGRIIVESVLPIIEPITKGIEYIAAGFTKLNPTIQKIVIAIVAIVAALGPVIVIVSGLVIAIAALGSAIATIGAIPILATIGGIIAILIQLTPVLIIVSLAVYRFYQAWQINLYGVQEVTYEVLDTVRSALNTLIKFIGTVINFIYAIFEGDYRTAWKLFVSIIQQSVEIVTRLVFNFFNGLLKLITIPLQAVFNYISGFFNNISAKTADWFDDLETTLILFFTYHLPNFIKNAAAKIYETATDIGGAIIQGIKDGIISGKAPNFLGSLVALKSDAQIYQEQIINEIAKQKDAAEAAKNYQDIFFGSGKKEREGRARKTRTDAENLAITYRKLSFEIRALLNLQTQSYELKFKVENLEQIKGTIENILKLRYELGIPLKTQLPTTVEGLQSQLEMLERLKSVREQIKKVLNEQFDAETEYVVALKTSTLPVVNAGIIAETKYLKAIRDRANAEQQLTAEIIVQQKLRADNLKDQTGRTFNAYQQLRLDTVQELRKLDDELEKSKILGRILAGDESKIEAEIGGKITITPPKVPTEMMQIADNSGKIAQSVTNIESLLGVKGGSKSGVSSLDQAKRLVESQGFVVGSTTGGRHNAGSLHYQGRALDVKIGGKTTREIEEFMAWASKQGFNVRDERTRPSGQKVWGGPHLHLSFGQDILGKEERIKKNASQLFDLFMGGLGNVVNFLKTPAVQDDVVVAPDAVAAGTKVAPGLADIRKATVALNEQNAKNQIDINKDALGLLISFETDLALARTELARRREQEERDVLKSISLSEEELYLLQIGNTKAITRVQRNVRDQRVKSHLSLKEEIITLEYDIANAGEDTADRLKKAHLSAIREIQEADIQAAESIVANQVKIADNMVIHSIQVDARVAEVLANVASMTDIVANIKVGIITNVFDSIQAGADAIAERFGKAAKYVKIFTDALADMFKLIVSNLFRNIFLGQSGGGQQGGGGGEFLQNILVGIFNPSGRPGLGFPGQTPPIFGAAGGLPFGFSDAASAATRPRIFGQSSSGSGNILSQIFGGAGGIGGALAAAAPLLGGVLGASVGGGSVLGQILGGTAGVLGGLLAPGIPSLLSGAASLTALGAVALPLIPALLIGAYFLGRNKKRRKNEEIRNQLMLDAFSELDKLIKDVQSDKVDGASALSRADEIRANYLTEAAKISDGKTRRIALADVHRIDAKISILRSAVSDQAQRRERLAVLVPTFAGGGPVYGRGTETSDSIPAYLSKGEYVLDAKTTRNIGVRNLNLIRKDRGRTIGRALSVTAVQMAEGGPVVSGLANTNMGGGGFSLSGMTVHVHVNNNIGEEPIKEIVGAYLVGPDGKQHSIKAVVSDMKENRRDSAVFQTMENVRRQQS